MNKPTRKVRRARRIAPIVAALVLTSVCSAPSAVENEVTVTGTLRAGADLGEVKQHCADGLYLVADEGTYLTGQTTMALLRVPEDGQRIGGT